MTTTTKKAHWTDQLVDVGACDDALEWCKTKRTAKSAWKTCKRGDWLLWIAAKLAWRQGGQGSPAHRAVVLAACACARLALPSWDKRYRNDRRVLDCIETTERWARGEAGVTLEDVRKARAAAAVAAYAAAAYAYAAAAAAADAAAAAAAARSLALAQCADIVRKMIPMPTMVTK